MGSDFNQNSDNDLPDWLQGMGSGEEDDSFDGGDIFGSDSDDSGEVPDWLQDTGADDSEKQEESEEGVPNWLSDIREAENQEMPTFMDEEPPEENTDDWLESIREQHESETEGLGRKKPSESEEQDAGDYMEEVRELKAQDEQTWDNSAEETEDDGWGSSAEEEPQDEIAAAWASDTGEVSVEGAELEEDVPDWLSGLPSLDPAEPPREDQSDQEEPPQTPDWLQNIGQESEVVDEPEEELEEEPEDELPHVSALSDPPPTTSSLPGWLENLQTAGLVLPADLQEDSGEADDEEAEAPAYDKSEFIDDDVSSLLFEADDLPDWLGEDVQEEEEEEEAEETVEPVAQPLEGQPTEDIEKAELPTWLQAMRPVEAVTAGAELEEEDETSYRAEEKVGPLSGLSDVLPAEPHVVHFGSEATPVPGFALTESQQRYAKLLLNLVKEETRSAPAERRSVALPQQILRWIIAAVLLVVLSLALWFNMGIFSLPASNIPAENIAVISTVSQLAQGQKVLVAFEYQPALAGEMESASAAIIDHLLLKGVDLVLFSSQPTGPGLAESFLQREFADNAYIQQHGYVNLGYLSGGSAALLNFAGNPRRAMPMQAGGGQSRWDQPPLNGITSIQDFALVLVITDNPDLARNWVEQVQPLLGSQEDGTGTPLVMAVSAQAEPLVYPYYLTSPKQVTGYISGIGGGAFYENTTTQLSVASRYWDAYNVGLLLSVLVIAIGAVLNLARNSIGGSIRRGRP